ncbi:MAG: hypothetical protein H6708_02485 [Kofleriaceae bacterium]|nr:hypothetical protein [Kofleriaceae bacterium]
MPPPSAAAQLSGASGRSGAVASASPSPGGTAATGSAGVGSPPAPPSVGMPSSVRANARPCGIASSPGAGAGSIAGCGIVGMSSGPSGMVSARTGAPVIARIGPEAGSAVGARTGADSSPGGRGRVVGRLRRSRPTPRGVTGAGSGIAGASVGTVSSPLSGPLASATGTPVPPLPRPGVAAGMPAGGVAGRAGMPGIDGIDGIWKLLPGTSPAGGVTGRDVGGRVAGRGSTGGSGRAATDGSGVRSIRAGRSGPPTAIGALASITLQVAGPVGSSSGACGLARMSARAPLGTVAGSAWGTSPGSLIGRSKRRISAAPSPSSDWKRRRSPGFWWGPCGIVDDDRTSTSPASTGV